MDCKGQYCFILFLAIYIECVYNPGFPNMQLEDPRSNIFYDSEILAIIRHTKSNYMAQLRLLFGVSWEDKLCWKAKRIGSFSGDEGHRSPPSRAMRAYLHISGGRLGLDVRYTNFPTLFECQTYRVHEPNDWTLENTTLAHICGQSCLH